MKNFRLFMVALCCPLAALCQDITGLWTGTMHNDSTGLDYRYEIGITRQNGKYIGFSHTWFNIDGKEYFGLKKIKVRIANDGKIVILDDELIASDYPVNPHKNVRQLNVLSFLGGANPVMDGAFETNRTKDYLPLTGKVTIQKKKDVLESDLYPHLQKVSSNVDWSFLMGSQAPVAKNEKE